MLTSGSIPDATTGCRYVVPEVVEDSSAEMLGDRYLVKQENCDKHQISPLLRPGIRSVPGHLV
ncbi:hypothetical protein HPP92_019889 [Vanilla planifolia]|uniref:Uncharacterized protein n=1 Tax=Vanilla planifolia TaxID=51239 RepID=A0A835Q3Q0_VANPL|nr:hypothetical protein HPP92_019889 [Vanilla planifolia]